MENTEEIYTDFARVYDELMDNTPYEMWCERLDQLIADNDYDQILVLYSFDSFKSDPYLYRAGVAG